MRLQNHLTWLVLIAALFCLTHSATAQDRFDTTGPYINGASYIYAGSDGTLYTVTLTAQVVRSTDDGASWTPCGELKIASGLIHFGTNSLAIDSAGVVYGISNANVWHSTDRGEHWNDGGVGLHGGYYLEASRTGSVFTTSGDTLLYRSTDQGVNWSKVKLPVGASWIRKMSIAPNGTLFGGGSGELLRSSDEGKSWTKINPNISTTDTVSVILATGGGRLWTMTSPSWALYTSPDSGNSWQQITTTDGLPPTTDVYNLAVSTKGTLLASTKAGIYRSADGGRNWTKAISLSSLYDIDWVAASPSGSLFGASNGVLHRSTDDGVNWSPVYDALVPASTTALAEADDETLLAGTVNNLYRSTDGGRNWIESSGLDTGRFTYRIVNGKSGRLFTTGFAGGVYASDNSGASWTSRNNGMIANWVRNITLARSGTLLLSAYGTERGGGIYRSTDNGEHWSKSGTDLPIDSVWDIQQAADGTLLAATQGSGIWRSTNDGVNWSDANTPGLTWGNIASLFVTPQGTIFAGTTTTDYLNLQGIFRSTDNGKSWQQVYLGYLKGNFIYAFGNNYFRWAVNEVGTIYVGELGFARSTDNGNTWTDNILWDLTQGVYNGGGLTVWGLMTDHTGRLHVGVGYTGLIEGQRVMVSDSGKAWIKDTLDAPNVRGFVQWYEQLLFVGTSNGVFWDTPTASLPAIDKGPWYPNYSLTSLDVRSLGSAGAYLLAGTSDGLYRMSFYDFTWRRSSQGLPAGAVNALATKQYDVRVFAGTEHGVYRSTDSGKTWSPDTTGVGDVPVNALILSGSNTLFAASPGHGLYRSEDGTQSWSRVNGGLPTRDVLSLAIISASTIYAGTDGAGVYRSIDNGATWTAAGTTLASEKINSITVNAEGLVFAGTDHGAWRSTDKGATWRQVNEGNGDTVQMVAMSGTGRIFIATEKGLYYSDNSKDAKVSSVPQEHRVQTSEASLLHVEPNPSSTMSEIRYELPRASHVELSLYDTYGRQLRVLASGDEEAGEHSLMLDASGLASGIYFLRLHSGNSTVTIPIQVTR